MKREILPIAYHCLVSFTNSLAAGSEAGNHCHVKTLRQAEAEGGSSQPTLLVVGGSSLEFNKISPGSASTTGRSSSSFQDRSRLTRRTREDKQTLGSVRWILRQGRTC